MKRNPIKFLFALTALVSFVAFAGCQQQESSRGAASPELSDDAGDSDEDMVVGETSDNVDENAK